MKFVIRVDDIGWTQHSSDKYPVKTVDSGLSEARRFHEAMGGMPWLAGVIPMALDAHGSSWIKSSPEGMTVAMHGVTHHPRGGVMSEFHRLSYERCRINLLEGLVELGVKATHFIPPFNALEPQLVKAVEDSGFHAIWGDHERGVKPPKTLKKASFVPASYQFYGVTMSSMNHRGPSLVKAVAEAVQRPGAAVITLHLPWELARCDRGSFYGVRELVKVVREHVVNPEEYLGMIR